MRRLFGRQAGGVYHRRAHVFIVRCPFEAAGDDALVAQAGGDICGAVIDGGRASVNVLSPGGLMICACFDAEGRMLSAETRPVTGLAGWQTLGFELPEGAARLSLMLLDSQNIPAAEGLSVDCA